jgi:hypothetical protein
MQVRINAFGDKIWHRDGVCHRDGDLPAIIRPDGTREWWQNGGIHRNNDLPAIIGVNRDQEWWQYGKKQCNKLVQKQLRARIVNENTRKVVLMCVLGFRLPQDVGMVVCNY